MAKELHRNVIQTMTSVLCLLLCLPAPPQQPGWQHRADRRLDKIKIQVRGTPRQAVLAATSWARKCDPHSSATPTGNAVSYVREKRCYTVLRHEIIVEVIFLASSSFDDDVDGDATDDDDDEDDDDDDQGMVQLKGG